MFSSTNEGLFEQMFSTNKIGLKLSWPVMLINKLKMREKLMH